MVRSTWACTAGGVKMSLDPTDIRIRCGRPYCCAQRSSASTAGVTGRPAQLCTAMLIPSWASCRASAGPSWTPMLSPNMKTPSVSRALRICCSPEIARAWRSQAPSTPEP